MSERASIFYESIYDLPLFNFVKISVYGDPEKWGVKPDAWEEISMQYSERACDKQMGRMFILMRNIAFLTTKLKIIDAIIDVLSSTRIEGMIEILQNDLGFKLKFEDLEADLKSVVSRCKSDVVKLKLAEKEYKDLQANNTEAPSEDSWNDEIAVLSKFQGYGIITKMITVSEYLAIKKQFKEDIERQNRK